MSDSKSNVVIAALIVTGCSKQSTNLAGGGNNAPLGNPSDFPLYQPSKVVSVAPIDTGRLIDAMMRSEVRKSMRKGETPPPAFRGSEVLASTSAPLTELRNWVKQLSSAPPKGLALDKRSSKANETQRRFMEDYGYDGAAFQSRDGKREVAVIVFDPKRVHDKLGMVFDLIDKYHALPGALRGGFDEQAKKQVGFSISDMLDKGSPVGLVVSATKELSTTGERAIVLVDGKTP